MPVAELIEYARIRYPKPDDQAYLNELAKVEGPDAKVRFKAIEKTRAGYVVTTPDGRLRRMTTDQRGKVRVDGRAVDERSLRAAVASLEGKAKARFGALTWPGALFSAERADATLAELG